MQLLLIWLAFSVTSNEVFSGSIICLLGVLDGLVDEDNLRGLGIFIERNASWSSLQIW